VPYIQAGLRHNECCVWICSEPLSVAAALESLAQSIGRLDAFLETGQLTLLPCERWYLEDGRMDAGAVCQLWMERLRKARSMGFEGLRVTGNTSWSLDEYFDALLQYEEKLRCFIGHDRIIALCSYPFRSGARLDPGRIIDVLNEHEYALVKRGGKWEAFRCPNRRRDELETLFDSISESILILGADGQILAANKVCLRKFGVESVLDLGRDLADFMEAFQFQSTMGLDQDDGAEYLSVPSAWARRVLRLDHDDESVELERHLWQATSRSGELRYFLIRVGPVRCKGDTWEEADTEGLCSAQGTHRGLAWDLGKGVAQGILTNRTQAERSSSGRYMVILQDITRLERAERVKEDFLRMMTHELQNPIQVAKGMLQLMRLKPEAKAPDMARYIQALERQISDLAVMLDNALTATRLGSGPPPIQSEEVDLTDVVWEVLEPYTLGSPHQIIPLFSRERGVPVLTDRSKVRQILSNLLRNASKYTPPGSRIWVDVETDGENCLVRIEDEGIGIPPNELETVFEAFHRASNVRRPQISHSPAEVRKGGAGSAGAGTSSLGAEAFSGIGLGLYISRGLARKLGGDLWAEVRQGGGTIMKLRLPLAHGGSDR